MFCGGSYFDKEGGVVGEPKGALQMESVHVAAAPTGDVSLPALFGAKEREADQVFGTDFLFLARRSKVRISDFAAAI